MYLKKVYDLENFEKRTKEKKTVEEKYFLLTFKNEPLRL